MFNELNKFLSFCDFKILLLTEKNSENQNKFPIEPISWNDVLNSDPNFAFTHVAKKQALPKPKRKIKLEALENERMFIRLITQDAKGQRSGLSRMYNAEKPPQSRLGALVSSHPPGSGGYTRQRRRHHMPRKPSPSDTSSDEQPHTKPPFEGDDYY